LRLVGHAGPDTLQEIKAEAQRTQAAQMALRDDPVARLEIEKRLLLDEVFPRLIAAAGQTVHFAGPATQVVIASGNAPVNAQQTSNDLSAILPLLDEFRRRRAELGLAQDQEVRLEKAVRSVEQELHKSDPAPSVVAGGLKVVKEIATKVIVNVAEKALTDHWHLLLDQLTHFINLHAR
jgi:hypothetical protein